MTAVTAYLDDRAHAHLQTLVETGLFGENPSAVAATLILAGLRKAKRDGCLPWITHSLAEPGDPAVIVTNAGAELEDQPAFMRAAFAEPPKVVRTPDPLCWLCDGRPPSDGTPCDACNAVIDPEKATFFKPLAEPSSAVPVSAKPRCDLCDDGFRNGNGDPCRACGRDIEIPF